MVWKGSKLPKSCNDSSQISHTSSNHESYTRPERHISNGYEEEIAIKRERAVSPTLQFPSGQPGVQSKKREIRKKVKPRKPTRNVRFLSPLVANTTPANDDFSAHCHVFRVDASVLPSSTGPSSFSALAKRKQHVNQQIKKDTTTLENPVKEEDSELLSTSVVTTNNHGTKITSTPNTQTEPAKDISPKLSTDSAAYMKSIQQNSGLPSTKPSNSDKPNPLFHRWMQPVVPVSSPISIASLTRLTELSSNAFPHSTLEATPICSTGDISPLLQTSSVNPVSTGLPVPLKCTIKSAVTPPPPKLSETVLPSFTRTESVHTLPPGVGCSSIILPSLPRAQSGAAISRLYEQNVMSPESTFLGSESSPNAFTPTSAVQRSSTTDKRQVAHANQTHDFADNASYVAERIVPLTHRTVFKPNQSRADMLFSFRTGLSGLSNYTPNGSCRNLLCPEPSSYIPPRPPRSPPPGAGPPSRPGSPANPRPIRPDMYLSIERARKTGGMDRILTHRNDLEVPFGKNAIEKSSESCTQDKARMTQKMHLPRDHDVIQANTVTKPTKIKRELSPVSFCQARSTSLNDQAHCPDGTYFEEDR
ncbi:hypothetical protein C8Q75DRAFT_354887 [Abortiporus biennis]|nr:hypothetical protein C8Q75DRAFT_354887 [Abortiporus biennis]